MIFELGYVFRRFQFYVGPGMAWHHQKFSSRDGEGQTIGTLSKTAPAPVWAMGTRYALNGKRSLGFEWQRHVGTKKPGIKSPKSCPREPWPTDRPC